MMAMRAGTAYLLSFTLGPPKIFQFLVEMVWQPVKASATVSVNGTARCFMVSPRGGAGSGV